jgi:hypothetical protein
MGFLFIKICIRPVYVVYICRGLVLIYERAVYVLNGTCYGACRHLIGQADQESLDQVDARSEDYEPRCLVL